MKGISNDGDGMMQPQAIDAEEAVLGAIILEKAAILEVIEILVPDAFYKESHRRIYEAVIELHNNSQPVELITLINQLKKQGQLEAVGGAFKITELTNRIASSANLSFHAKIIMEHYFRREAIKKGAQIVKDAYDNTNDVFEVLSKSVDGISDIFNHLKKDNSKTGRQLAREVIIEIEKQIADKRDITGIASGLTEIDKITGGFQNGDLIIIAARPAMGKTSYATQLAVNAVKNGEAVFFSSLEMTSTKIMARILASELSIDSKLLTKDVKKLDIHELSSRLGDSASANSDDFIIDDTSEITINELITVIKKKNFEREATGNKKFGLIVIDYLQLLYGSSSKNGMREQEISEITRKLKNLAKELKVPVIALSQLSRKVEERKDKRPMLSDLRESGSIEQDADIVKFLLRPEYYGIHQDEDGNHTSGKAIVIFAKNRNGSTGDAVLRFESKYTRFSNIEKISINEVLGKDTINDNSPF